MEDITDLPDRERLYLATFDGEDVDIDHVGDEGGIRFTNFLVTRNNILMCVDPALSHGPGSWNIRSLKHPRAFRDTQKVFLELGLVTDE